jgi:trk system potassium uptake protein TrkA
VIDGGDELFFVTTIAAEDELRALLSAEPAEAPGDGHHPEGVQPVEAQVPEDDGFDG